MRLLHTTNLELISFIGKPVKERPRYAILSHRWKDDEFLFEEARNGISQHLQNPRTDLQNPRTGLQKILNACEKARQNNLDYIWVDTCCIDKSSSAELSEAINSMFKWYKESVICYVFMDDVTLEVDGVMQNFDSSCWFTRGWTLQELIAPHGLLFFDCEWNYMCSRDQISSRLEEITGITASILQRAHIFPPSHAAHDRITKAWCRGCRDEDDVETQLAEEPISRKMRWAANRSTTRPEDTSYCLLGLFDINMPLLYGEGENAFGRLQEEILKKSPDQSILTWTEDHGERFHKPYLAKMPSEFQFAVRRPEMIHIERGDIIATPRGLEIDVLLVPCTIRINQGSGLTSGREQFMAILSCAIDADPLLRVAIFVEPLTPGALDTAYTRVLNYLLIQLNPAAEPLILTGSKSGIEEFKAITVEYDPRKLSLSRILLAAIRPMRESFKQRPGVYIVAPGIEKVKINVIKWVPSDKVMISYQQPISRGGGVGHLSVGGAWYVGNDDSGFFILWGVTVFPDDRDVVCWAETRGSFLRGNHVEVTSLNNLERHSFSEALQRYMRDGKGPLSPCISEPGFKVRVKVTTIEFLGRKTHRVILDIDGWESRPVSIVDCLQVVAHDWI